MLGDAPFEVPGGRVERLVLVCIRRVRDDPLTRVVVGKVAKGTAALRDAHQAVVLVPDEGPRGRTRDPRGHVSVGVVRIGADKGVVLCGQAPDRVRGSRIARIGVGEVLGNGGVSLNYVLGQDVADRVVAVCRSGRGPDGKPGPLGFEGVYQEGKVSDPSC